MIRSGFESARKIGKYLPSTSPGPTFVDDEVHGESWFLEVELTREKYENYFRNYVCESSQAGHVGSFSSEPESRLKFIFRRRWTFDSSSCIWVAFDLVSLFDIQISC